MPKVMFPIRDSWSVPRTATFHGKHASPNIYILWSLFHFYYIPVQLWIDLERNVKRKCNLIAVLVYKGDPQVSLYISCATKFIDLYCPHMNFT